MTQVLTSPLPIQFKGSHLARILLRLGGWRFTFEGLPSLQGVIIGYPHTSNWDFVVMILVKWGIGLPIQFLAKDSLFRVLFLGRWLAWLGGVAIDRSSPKGLVAHLVAMFKQHQQNNRYLWLALSPEGTRRRTDGWRSGFYQVALLAGVPLCLVRIDYGQKTVHFSNFMQLSGDESADYAQIAHIYEGVKGFHPTQAAPIRPFK